MKVVHAEGNLLQAAMLVKPALLYADKVTIYSPAAWMLKSFDEFAQLSDPRAQVSAMLDVLRNVPALAPDLKMDEGTLSQLLTLLTLDRSKLRTAGRALGGAGEIDDLYRHLDGLQQVWEEQMPQALAGAAEAIGGSELLPAMRSGVVQVADMTSASSSAVIAHAVSAALGDSNAASSDAMVEAFMGLAIDRPRRRCISIAGRPGLWAYARRRRHTRAPTVGALNATRDGDQCGSGLHGLSPILS